MKDTHDVIVIGAGSAGLTAAGGCAMFGLKVALIERGTMGGECLNTGCVPSKALIAAAGYAAAARDGARFGVHSAAPRIDYAGVRAHIAGAIAAIAPHDSRERFEALGVEVVAGSARFLDARTVQVGDRRLAAPRIVVATGSRPRIPELPGLVDTPYVTNETVWEMAELPRHLAVLGGGAIGMELAQAYRRLGAEVTVIEETSCLAHEDAAAAEVVRAKLRGEGVRLLERAKATTVERRGDGLLVSLHTGGAIGASHLLVVVGREPRLDGLALAAAGVRVAPDGIPVDARRRTSAPHIFAIGDCRQGPRFTHLAGEDGAVVARNIALGWPAKIDLGALPRVVFTDPELARIGMTEAEAREAGDPVAVEVQPFREDDRAVTAGRTEGFVKMVRSRRRLVGVTIVGRHAGELLAPWSLAMRGKASAFALAGGVIAYPTRSERSKAVAFAAYEPIVFSRVVRRWARLLARLRRRG